MPLAETVTLNNGNKMPLLGLGTFAAEDGGKSCADAVCEAIKSGYRLIDGAHVYLNEEAVGDGIARGIKEAGIKREDLFVTSKLWSSRMHPDEVEPAIRRSLAKLKLDYLDLYLVHWPHAFKRGDEDWPVDANGKALWDESIHPTDTYLELEKLVKKGLVRNIGVSNYNSVQLEDVLKRCTIKPVTNQVECHPFFAQEKLRAFMVSRGVIMTGYSPLAASHGHWPRPAEASNLLQDPKLTAIGQKYGKSPAQVVLRWMTQRGIVAVPKSATPSRIAANIDVFDFRLTDEEMKTVNGFDLGHPKGRFLKGHLGEDLNCKHKHFPFGIEF